MKLPTISFDNKTTPDYQPTIKLPRIAAILKDRPGQAAYALAQEIRNPLGHINLSVEMLESIVEDNDLKMYLDVIMRNSIRIGNLMHEFLLESHLADAGQAENISNQKLP